MSRAKKMVDEQRIEVRYWPDTGPVEVHLERNQIIKAQMVEAKPDSDIVPLWESHVRPEDVH